MGRKSLLLEIRDADHRLDRRRDQLAWQLDGVRARLRRVHPGWWLGGGVAAGYLAGRRGAAATLRYARAGLSLASMVQAGLTAGAAGR
jgi:hypothetical protein